MKVLVVDDEPYVLGLLARQFALLGFDDVVTCERAHEAVAMLDRAAGEVGLVVCDLNMPEMDGVELVRHLAERNYGGALVLVSGEDERILKTCADLARARQLEVLGALSKPTSLDQLQEVLRKGNLVRAVKAPGGARKTYGQEELLRAIAGGELENHYQPKVELATGRVVGVETLVRWRHPRDGLVYPDQFIGTAEEHGLINALTRAVLAHSLRQIFLWRDARLELQHVAVNVSVDDLKDLDFPDFVVRAADQAWVSVAELVLEVTESRLMTHRLAALDILARLRLKRIGLAIDDFGTGHSSLVQLRDIPFDELKIDRGFIHGACRDGSLRAIVEASLGMARQMGIKTVAEGVEDREDWNFLREVGCDQAQGYLIAKPMRADELPAWMAGWAARYDDLKGASS